MTSECANFYSDYMTMGLSEVPPEVFQMILGNIFDDEAAFLDNKDARETIKLRAVCSRCLHLLD